MDYPRIDSAINLTVQYYEIERIKYEFEYLSGTPTIKFNGKTIAEDYYEIVFLLHERMEKEIIQTIENCYPATQILLFEYLKEWLNDYRIIETNVIQVSYVVNTYNENLYQEFLKKVNEEEDKFKSTSYYPLPHDAEYQVEEPQFSFIGALLPYPTSKKLVTKKNNKFFCLNNTPEYLDDRYFRLYIDRLDKIVSNFKRILSKYVSMYENRKLPTQQNIAIAYPTQPQPEIKELPQPLIHPPKKLKANLTVEQIAYLFKMLYDEGVIQASTYKEIHEFISKNFIPSTKEEDISIGKISRIWSNFNIRATINFWIGKFIDLHNRSKKDNPNNIK